MWTVPRPSFDAREVYVACYASLRDEKTRESLVLLDIDVVFAAYVFASVGPNAMLHTLTYFSDRPTSKDVQAALKKAYTAGMVENKPGRYYYDRLLAAAVHGRCPLCGHGRVSTLDHQLPKSSYPLLAVVPDNLVPACADCNHRKNDLAPSSSETQTLHPYFDDANQARWLAAQVVPGEDTTVRFYADPVATFGPTMQARIRHHFKQFKLEILYGLQAAQELAGIHSQISKLRQAAGPDAVAEELRSRAESWAEHSLNCWQHAMYEALAADQAYLANG
ncbi:HNH endonuclease signature motif containing protein [Micromonospora sp. WMMD710]|uniref:HNH endonuclease n=1 Tax=Micromonospora sp. WMMD710 TaxID=3016085 RepID=UPI0024170E98|nr:HNH endonuclease signature motif containing protein [Micromonospora sp. WMMD710]MDG4760479.1 HNH endonuclease signature motif containing protein [Micromonospora sp. WMMD710]